MNELSLASGSAYWLPVIFSGLMVLAFFIYAILDGYDLGVGILLPMQHEPQRDIMIASIGPFWDANETWLVLGVGIMLIAFPAAHSLVLFHLYLPVTIMLAGLILRGVAFDFRAKAPQDHKTLWDRLFKLGSVLATLAQGYMLGIYVMGFEASLWAYLFACLSAICVTAGYSFIGGAWLVMKTEGELQQRALVWTRRCGYLTALGIGLVSVVNPLISPAIFAKWFSGANWLFLLIIPILCGGLFLAVMIFLSRFGRNEENRQRLEPLSWAPFVAVAGIFLLCFVGLSISFFPYIVPNQLTIWQAASAAESLQFILYGVILVLPTIVLYTLFAYRIFWGKATQLKYY